MKNAGVMLEFIDFLDIPTSGMQASFDSKNNKIELERVEKIDERDAVTQIVTVKMSEKNNTVFVKNEVKKEVKLDKNMYGISDDYKYKVDDIQAYTKFKVNEGKMDVYTAMVKGSKTWDRVDMDTISDLINDDNMPCLVYGDRKIPIKKTTYSLPEGYGISNGVFNSSYDDENISFD